MARTKEYGVWVKVSRSAMQLWVSETLGGEVTRLWDGCHARMLVKGGNASGTLPDIHAAKLWVINRLRDEVENRCQEGQFTELLSEIRDC